MCKKTPCCSSFLSHRPPLYVCNPVYENVSSETVTCCNPLHGLAWKHRSWNPGLAWQKFPSLPDGPHLSAQGMQGHAQLDGSRLKPSWSRLSHYRHDDHTRFCWAQRARTVLLHSGTQALRRVGSSPNHLLHHRSLMQRFLPVRTLA